MLLVERGLFESRAKARAAIEAGGVKAGGAIVAKPSEMLEADAEIVAEPAHPWVSRSGLKLQGALDLWPVVVKGRIVLDVGASTGGFTQVCLSRGAARVFAVDVGTGQLHASVGNDPRVANLEQTDARALTPVQIDAAPQLIVCDVSFISLIKALPAVLELAATGADLVCLVKPQFEVGRAHVGRGGIVKDINARERALSEVRAWLETQGWRVQATADSPITGADGNAEYLLWARKA